jgi:8-oxo-dGTP diphosphatase
MRERPSARRSALSVDVIMLTPHGRRLALLLIRSADPRAKERWELPWDSTRPGESLDEAAARIARAPIAQTATALEQVATIGDSRRHPGGAEISVGFLALVPAGAPAPVGGTAAWFPVDELPTLPPRHRALVDAGLAELRTKLETSPIAFRLLPPAFTLSQLQEIYELLLGRRLHKASFRRALQAAFLVEPTDEWRSEGRGRPAQLFRYAPRKRRGARRGVRFDAIA